MGVGSHVRESNYYLQKSQIGDSIHTRYDRSKMDFNHNEALSCSSRAHYVYSLYSLCILLTFDIIDVIIIQKHSNTTPAALSKQYEIR
jgi:hypothetical protein